MRKAFFIFLIAASAATVFGAVAYANHAWGPYHWARQSNPFTLKLGDNVSSLWDPHLATASSDWSLSSVLDTSVVSGQANPKSCRPSGGRVEVCNAKYGSTGWLGVAQIWITGGEHITQGTVRLNDTYFNSAPYNSSAWRQFVACQEVGHTFGLGHQDEIFSNPNLGTCMDYTNDPSTNQHPNQHDYDELELIYAHLDGFTTLNAKQPSAGKDVSDPGVDLDGPPQWGKVIQASGDGKPSVYERDLGNGHKVLTFVIWAD